MSKGTKNYFRHYVYVFGDGADCDMGIWYSGFIKVGMTTNIKNRLKAIQNCTARKIEIILVIGLNSKQEAEIIELGIHSKLQFHKENNEWFRFNSYTKRHIEKLKVGFFKNITQDYL